MKNAIDEAAAVASERLAGVGPAPLFDAARAVPSPVGIQHTAARVATAFKPLVEVYPDGAALAAALDAGELPAREAALDLLAEREPDAAAELAMGLMRVDLTGKLVWSFEALFQKRAAELLPRKAAALSPALVSRAVFEGLVRLDALPESAVAALPLDRLLAAVKERKIARLPGKALRGHPELQRGEQIAAFLDRALAAGNQGDDLLGWLCKRLGEARHEPSVAGLAALWSKKGNLRDAAGKALLAIGTPAALGPLASSIPAILKENKKVARGARIWDLDVAIEGALRMDPATASARLAPHFQAPALASEAGAAMARQTLALLAQGGHEELLAADAGWLPLAAQLASEPKVREEVKALLSKMDKAAVKKALEAAKPKEAARPKEAAKPKEAAAAPRAAASFLARYRAGAHVEVWNEMRALGAAAGEPGIREEVQAVAEETMGRVRRNLERVVQRLADKGYKLAARKKALGQPAPKGAIEALERLAGGPVPASLRAFYAVVGSIDLREGGGAYREGEQLFETLGAQDPLVVLGAREIARERAHERELLPELREPLRAFLSPGAAAKGYPEGGDEAPFTMSLPDGGADGVVATPGAPGVPFVDYLRHYLRWGGFPGLARKTPDADPSWPGLSILTANLEDF